MQQTCWNSSRHKIPATLLLSNLSQSKQRKPVDIFKALQLFSRRAQASPNFRGQKDYASLERRLAMDSICL